MKKTTRKTPQSVKTQRKIDAAVDFALQQQEQQHRSKVALMMGRHVARLDLLKEQVHSITPNYLAGMLDETQHTGLLVANWKNGWKWFSNLALAAIVAINTSPIPPEIIDALPPDARQQVTIGLAVVGILGRFINQSRKKEADHV